MPESRVRPIFRRSKTDVSDALAAGWARVSAGRRGAFADNVDITTKTLNRALTGESLPELHTALNSLADDPTALDEVLALYGRRLAHNNPQRASDMALVHDLAVLLGEFTGALADQKRCHLETIALATLIRPLLPQLSAIVAEADAVRGVPSADVSERN